MSRQLRAAAERSALCDLLDAVGPEAPTLCSGWTAADLAAHLVVRESLMLAGAGAFVPASATRTGALRRALRRPFPTLVDRIRRGGLLPLDGRLGEALHLLEFVVRRQDILRAQPDTACEPHDGNDPELDAAVFAQLRHRAGHLGRRIPSGVGLLVRSERQGAIEVRRGPVLVVVDGNPVDLAMWLFGRTAVSVVTVEHDGNVDVRSRVEASLRR